ncbi:hypothetical protein ABXJ56_11925 [Microbacterium chocolatum]|uniref:hypothetical protein n=1 Tax=Microbacterium aurantiacum TaxID=162393 RepID=UPI00338F717E
MSAHDPALAIEGDPMSTTSRRRAGLLLAGILLLSGCTAATQTQDRPVSPIDEYLLAGEGTAMSAQERREAGDARLLAREEVIAECMKEQGFDYIPAPPTPLGFDFNTWGSPELDDPDWIDRWGYGIVDGPDQVQVTIPDDPNEAIVEGLTDSERTAYYEALVGSPDAYDADGLYDPSQGGCLGEAEIADAADDPLRGDRFRALNDAVLAFYAELNEQQDIVALNARWAACMADEGEDGFASPLDPISEINVALQELVSEGGETAWDNPEIERLRERETALAHVDARCREAVDYRAAEEKVRFEAEERFVADNRAELEAYRAAAEGAGS